MERLAGHTETQDRTNDRLRKRQKIVLERNSIEVIETHDPRPETCASGLQLPPFGTRQRSTGRRRLAPKQGRRPTLKLLGESEPSGLRPWGQRSRGPSAPAEG
jgi:hypothetical protein